LLIRELPVTVTEEIIRSSLGKYTDLTIQRVQISSSKLYAFVQMRSSDEAGTVLHIFNKTVPYIDNCAGLITVLLLKLKLLSDYYLFAPVPQSNTHTGKCKYFEEPERNQ